MQHGIKTNCGNPHGTEPRPTLAISAQHGMKTDQIGIVVSLVLNRVDRGACPIEFLLTLMEEVLEIVDGAKMEGQGTHHGQQRAQLPH